MNAREMVARLNDLDEQLCGAFRVPRSGDAATLDEAITMASKVVDERTRRRPADAADEIAADLLAD